MTTTRRPPGRYDEPAALPRPLLVVLACALLLAVTAGSFWAYQRSTRGQVDYVLIGYEVRSDTSVTVTFEVRKPAAAEVRCRVEALGETGLTVGSKDVQLGPDADKRVTTSLTTTSRASAGVVRGCREEAG